MNEPKLRFVAFSDELSHHTLRDIIVEKPSNGIMNRQSDKVTAVKHINVIDMYTDDKIHVDELSYSEYGDTAVEKCNVEIGDIFLTRSSVKADGIAKSNILLDDGIYVYDDHLIRLKVDKSKYIPEFVNDYLASPRFRRQFIVKAKTTAFTTIGQGDVASCTGDFPSLPEQQKIADFLSTIDTVIAKQKETVSAWEERKKGVMQKLFSQEVRFKADDGSDFPEWEEKKLGDDVQFLNGRAYKQDELLKSGKYLVLRVGNLFTNDSYYYSDLELDDDKYIENGNLIYAWSATFGPRIYHGEKCIYHYHIWKLKFDENAISKIFLNYCLLHDVENIKSQRTGGTMVHITKNAMENRKLYFPCFAEQQKIADCLSSLDEVIEKQKATLTAWEELKKGLLQQMFV